MLRKLMKHEIKGSGRLLLPVFLALFIMTLINKIFLSINSQATGFIMTTGISMALYITIMVALVVMTFIVIIMRFYKNLMTDEGYLMFTLPVATWQQILSKLIIAIMWSLVCGLVIFLSIFILSLGENTGEFFGELGKFMSEISKQGYMGTAVLFTIEFVVMMITGIAAQILQVYGSISVGQLSEKHKVVVSVVAYVVINIILQIILTIFMVVVGFNANDMLRTLIENTDPVVIINWSMNLMTLGNLILGAIFFFGSNYLLKNKLNLE